MFKTASLIFFFILSHFIVLGQNESKYVNHLRTYQLDFIEQDKIYSDAFTKDMILWQAEFLKSFNIHASSFNTIENIEIDSSSSIYGQFYFYINKGDYIFYKLKNHTEARQLYLSALNMVLETDNAQLICEALKKILSLNRHSYLLDNTTSQAYLDVYKEKAYDDLEKAYYAFYSLTFSFQHFRLERWDTSLAAQLENFTTTSDYHFLNGLSLELLGSYHAISGNLNQAITYNKKSIAQFDQIPYNYKSTKWKNSHIGLARYLLFQKQFKSADSALQKIKSKPNNAIEASNERFIYYYQSQLDSINSDYLSAYKNLMQYTGQTEITLLENNQNAFNELETKYQTEKKEQENIALKRRNRNTIFIALGVLLSITLIGALSYKNTRRKQLLVEQEKELQTQKLANVLKEQELMSIDAMIEGQEKERQRIANDLHDDLGSLMATLKIYFNAFKENKTDDLSKKTEQLIDDAYAKVRTVAHAKNSGVIAKDGLLKSIQHMANKISEANKIDIEVLDHHLDGRLENSLELTIFRIIQELITNILKHADATQASIHITNHEDSLNIMVEDNGQGFDTSAILKKSGMGIHSIDKRIESLGGTIDIESQINQGTTVIIDIPL